MDLNTENKIRQLMIEFLGPYVNQLSKLKEQGDSMRNMIFQDRREMEEMKHNVARMKKYDDFFQECTKKIFHNEYEIRQIEKKIQEEVNSLWNNKYVLAEKVA